MNSQEMVETKVIMRWKSFCSKSPTGKHKWEAVNGHYICKHCDAITDEQVLVG